VVSDWLSVRDRVDHSARQHSGAQHINPIRGAEHLRVPASGMVGMGMGDDRPVDRSPGINEEIPSLTVQAAICHLQQGTVHLGKV
jgi:hypothetical protein